MIVAAATILDLRSCRCSTQGMCSRELYVNGLRGYVASSPGLLIGGEGGEGLVSTACACATFSVYFTVKVSVNVYRRYPYVIGLFKI